MGVRTENQLTEAQEHRKYTSPEMTRQVTTLRLSSEGLLQWQHRLAQDKKSCLQDS
jgi:hypothetical protein